jgi:hypothetical protein
MIREILWLAIGNLGRRLAEWADRRGDRADRHVIELVREAWTSK